MAKPSFFDADLVNWCAWLPGHLLGGGVTSSSSLRVNVKFTEKNIDIPGQIWYNVITKERETRRKKAMKKIINLNEVKDYDLLCMVMENDVTWHDGYIEYEEEEEEE